MTCIQPNEIVVDLFAGGGGASTGIEAALGRPVTIAVNHSAAAIAMHERNHPSTRHFHEDVWRVSPRAVCGECPVGLLWLSPACTHFSRAKGGQNPKSAKIRSLAYAAVRWAREVRPRVIVLENVVEFLQWGPLDDKGRPIASKRGRSFAIWLGKLKARGYQVEWRVLCAADYGAPTSRKRLFLIARCDGAPIVWPAPTHGPKRARPWNTAADCIDWSLPCPSIFDRKKPLAEATLRRIAAGVMRFVVDNPRPFIVPITHNGGVRVHDSAEPLRTITTAHRGEFAVVAPSVVKYHGGVDRDPHRGQRLDEPLRTVDTENRFAVIAPTLTKHYGTDKHGAEVVAPTPTITSGGEHIGIAAATLVQSGYGEREGQDPRVLDVEKPLGTIVSGAAKHAAVSAFLTKHYGGVVGQPAAAPASTITSTDHHALTTVSLATAGRANHVRAFLLKYFSGASKKKRPKGSARKRAATLQGQVVGNPMHTITTRDRFALVTVDGVEYEIADIGMRMLAPHELWRAQGFDAPDVTGLTKTQQIQLCGNSVCPQVAEAIIRAQFGRLASGAEPPAAQLDLSPALSNGGDVWVRPNREALRAGGVR